MLELLVGAVCGAGLGTYKSDEMRPCFDNILTQIRLGVDEVKARYQEYKAKQQGELEGQ